MTVLDSNMALINCHSGPESGCFVLIQPDHENQ